MEPSPPSTVVDSQLLLHECVCANNIELLKQLLRYNISLDAVDNYGRTALNRIDFGTDTEVLQLLVYRGMCVNTKDKHSLTPLAKVVGFDDLPKAEFLVSCGADTNDWIGAPGTLIHLACAESSLDMIRLLVDNNANLNATDESMNGTVFQSACQRCESNGSKSEVLNYLLSTGRIDLQQNSAWWGSNINTACLMADHEIVQRLVDGGANVEASDKIGRKPIHFALYKSLDFVRCLQEKGASLDATDKIGRNALHFAVLSGRLDVVQHVLSHKRDMINMPDRDGWTPLFWALRNAAHWTTGRRQQGEIVRHLIAEGAQILIRDNDRKWSPLQVAQYHGHKEDILSQVRPTEEQINAIEDGGEKRLWELTVARQPKPAGKYDRAYCDVCLVVSCTTFLQYSPQVVSTNSYTCHFRIAWELITYATNAKDFFCVSNVFNPRIWYIHMSFLTTRMTRIGKSISMKRPRIQMMSSLNRVLRVHLLPVNLMPMPTPTAPSPIAAVMGVIKMSTGLLLASGFVPYLCVESD